MLVLVTGLPGNGKTLYALNWVRTKAEQENRPVYYSGIADLMLPWTEIDPEKWMDCPANSLIVIDEAQRIYRPRMHGVVVPAHVSALETHRHKGVDIVLITQHPMLVDSSVRRLAGLHFHLVRKFGAAASTVHEWGSVKDNCDKSRADSTRHDFIYPKGAYAWYKSAEVHTHKLRIPARVWLLLSIPLLVGAAVWAGYRWFTKTAPAATSVASTGPGGPVAGGAGSGSSSRQSDRALTPAQYADRYVARVPGLAYTAPVYDEVTEVKAAPYPAACVAAADKCACYTQQGTALPDVGASLCRQIVANGFFVAWQVPDPPRPSPTPPATNQPGDRGGTPQVVSLSQTSQPAAAMAAVEPVPPRGGALPRAR